MDNSLWLPEARKKNAYHNQLSAFVRGGYGNRSICPMTTGLNAKRRLQSLKPVSGCGLSTVRFRLSSTPIWKYGDVGWVCHGYIHYVHDSKSSAWGKAFLHMGPR
ncbi:predicted protein [Coccidioides posadasii str. Silveira]|uniref:Predicted protein n=1 Tax=Coccidioides posadasii (strain RMSCC 757 / Silveira) TaxID=443226 RepID=E9CSC7_COCPS|nr:predicted protein [Coccidioides posadasii str. Silveira]